MKTFSTCPTCPNPKSCKAAGRCLMKAMTKTKVPVAKKK